MLHINCKSKLVIIATLMQNIFNSFVDDDDDDVDDDILRYYVRIANVRDPGGMGHEFSPYRAAIDII